MKVQHHARKGKKLSKDTRGDSNLSGYPLALTNPNLLSHIGCSAQERMQLVERVGWTIEYGHKQEQECT